MHDTENWKRNKGLNNHRMKTIMPRQDTKLRLATNLNPHALCTACHDEQRLVGIESLMQSKVNPLQKYNTDKH